MHDKTECIRNGEKDMHLGPIPDCRRVCYLTVDIQDGSSKITEDRARRNLELIPNAEAQVPDVHGSPYYLAHGSAILVDKPNLI